MPSIPLAEAMVVWTPDTELWRNSRNAAPAGSIAVVHWPDDRDAYQRYPKSDCAGSHDWHEGNVAYRLDRLAKLVGQLIEEEGLNPEHVSEALRAIDMPAISFGEALKREKQRRRLAAEAAD
jgi:hypothetical protein